MRLMTGTQNIDKFSRKGQLSLEMLIFSAVALVLIGGFVLWAGSYLNLSLRDFNKTLSFSIAESGIEYYRWHLAHAPADYQDGTGQAGPYIHSYFDKDGNLLGSFTLEIIPPLPGSTVVTIKSTGRVASDNTVQKVIQVKMGVPSYAKYAWLLNDNVVFGSAAQVFGPIHSNTGIRFDGTAYNLVTSAQTQYDDPSHSGAQEYAVHTHRSPVDPLPPTPLPSRPDVFAAGRQVGIPAVDFNALTQTLSQLRQDSQTSGFYRPSSTVQGYDILLKTNGTFDLYKVMTQTSPGGCSYSQPGWGTWTVATENLLGNYPYPTSGLMFFEDNIWVRGQIDNVRLTIGAGKFPDPITNRPNITVNKNLLYTNYDGRDVIALISQNNINVGLGSDDNLRIDGALVAQNGWVGRYSYPQSACGSTRKRTQLTTYGILATNLRPGFYYTSTNGYQARQYNYDANLLYGPPPSFPRTSDNYVQISWEEVQ